MTAVFETTVLLRGEETAGEIALVRNTVPAGWSGPPLHHHAFDEGFYVLEGELAFQLGSQLVTRTPGELAFAPRGAPHALANPGTVDARYLLLCAPAGFERDLAGLPAELAGVEPP